MNFKKAKLAAAVAALSVAGMGVSQNAAAYAYAYSFLDIYNFAATPTNGVLGSGSVSGTGTAEGVSTVCGPVALGALCDIPVANSGAAIPNNNFGQHENAAPSFAHADGLVPVGGTQALDQAEAQSSTAQQWDGEENYDLSATVGISSGGGFMTFAFDAQGLLQAKLNGGAFGTDQAQANYSFNITLTDNLGNVVFDWGPDGGGAGATTGGTVQFDPFSLQTSIVRIGLDGGDLPIASGPGFFQATTNNLVAGTYFLSVSKETSVNARFHNVPEPASLALLGLGIAGIGVSRARRKVCA